MFSVQKYGGVSRYFIELDRCLNELGESSSIFPYIYVNKYLKEESYPRGVYFSSLPNKLRIKLNDLFMSAQIKRAEPDILHHTNYTANDFGIKKAKKVVTVYDMIHEKYWGKFSEVKKESVLSADHVICISNNTRDDLLGLYDLDEAKTSVIYLGNEIRNVRAAKLELDYRYILYVGHRDEYKNFSGLLEAYAGSKSLKDTVKIIAFGKKFKQREIGLINKLGICGGVINMTGGDDVLSALYQEAEVFVYPSKYEGFGLPPLEAMSYGCPVICSNSSSIPEVVGDAAIQFDPENTEQLAQNIEDVLNSSDLRNKLIAKGYDRVKMFTWRKCALETQKLYKSLLNE